MKDCLLASSHPNAGACSFIATSAALGASQHVANTDSDIGSQPGPTFMDLLGLETQYHHSPQPITSTTDMDLELTLASTGLSDLMGREDQRETSYLNEGMMTSISSFDTVTSPQASQVTEAQNVSTESPAFSYQDEQRGSSTPPPDGSRETKFSNDADSLPPFPSSSSSDSSDSSSSNRSSSTRNSSASESDFDTPRSPVTSESSSDFSLHLSESPVSDAEPMRPRDVNHQTAGSSGPSTRPSPPAADILSNSSISDPGEHDQLSGHTSPTGSMDLQDVPASIGTDSASSSDGQIDYADSPQLTGAQDPPLAGRCQAHCACLIVPCPIGHLLGGGKPRETKVICTDRHKVCSMHVHLEAAHPQDSQALNVNLFEDDGSTMTFLATFLLPGMSRNATWKRVYILNSPEDHAFSLKRLGVIFGFASLKRAITMYQLRMGGPNRPSYKMTSYVSAGIQKDVCIHEGFLDKIPRGRKRIHKVATWSKTKVATKSVSNKFSVWFRIERIRSS